MINRNVLKIGITVRLVVFPLLTVVYASDWVEPTISRAISTSQSESRQLMLFFTSRTCEPCKALEDALNMKEMEATFSEKFVIAIVDIDSFDGQACSRIYEVGNVPAVVVVDPNGTVRYKGSGEMNSEDLMAIMRNERTWDPTKPGSTGSSAFNAGRSTEVTKRPYALQIGFFSNETNADRMKEKAVEAGYEPVYVAVEERNQKPHYRVLVGAYDNENEATSGKASLAAAGFDVRIYRRTP